MNKSLLLTFHALHLASAYQSGWLGSRLYTPRLVGQSNNDRLVMRDTSAASWFRVGDRVRVVDEVVMSGSVDLK
jgi:hypothetical protein